MAIGETLHLYRKTAGKITWMMKKNNDCSDHQIENAKFGPILK